MAVFDYSGLDARHLPVAGSIAADSPRQARDLLRGRGIVITRVLAHVDISRHARKTWSRRPRVDASKVVMFIRELATLLSVGIPQLDALDTIVRQHHGALQTVLLVLRDRIAAGSTLSDAMREQPMVFDDLCVNITQVGEDAGTLESALERLAEFKERSQQLKGRIANALLYPVMVLSMAIGLSFFLMSFVVPQILEPLVALGRPLPLPTRIVKGASDLLLGWWWLLGLAFATLSLLVGALLRSERGRRHFHRLQLRLPILGGLVQKQAIVRLAIVLSVLLKSGIVFVRALEIGRQTSRNSVFREALARIEQIVGAGGDIATAMEQTRAFPPLVVHVFAAGQQSGRLEEMLDRLARDYDQQIATATQRLAAALEPLLIIVLAVLVLCIALATLLPILEAGDVLG